MSTLYIVATPIGNLEDISPRALETLRAVDLVVCEDTRVTKKLLKHYGITTLTESYHARSSPAKIEKIVNYMKEGKDIALVSDAGTPAISDPGALLVSRATEALGEHLLVVPIPGPSAVTAALSASGLPASEFLFLGFLPHKKGRAKLFSEITASMRTVVFYESPHRILKTLGSLAEALSPVRRVVIARELTKIFEEVVSGSPAAVASFFMDNPDKVRGEFVVMVSGAR
ncbi:MAG: 16S rRNA (cytidine(1402)-2'-O)-methyltransferase [Candidatus Lloydbacteria bacterium CG22_combo_CG10-13_8_21_14_all_47_15]|uniref:Ribosomal RNA small subunit methyltransferase I n=1 Tax=Candidatus Lloydbacteria bacterium CG22_combo_CG10-13_8_21_14_all_47_15 TaxID=1974635 RepID=A0A2H0CU91_9BACT|nr:MAG: 16S rRNA (cytidine(1402)-2'-O)-methyltransferase [Candidatus Lloydbacteria bacterium CG22_combo_CG10-13_8_21_14_all_47_15]